MAYNRPRLYCLAKTRKDWCDLPPELLSKIADSLGLIDLLRFRGVCREWKSASSTASAQIELQKQPWFLLRREGRGFNSCILLSNGGLTFRVTIPEMDRTTCLSSYAGWLLLYRENSMFFFCPFSRSKITLPSCPFRDPSYHMAAFSSPPTSPDCVVAVLRSTGGPEVRLFLLRKGSAEWEEQRYHTEPAFRRMGGAIFLGRTFNVLDGSNGRISYNDEIKEWKRDRLVPWTIDSERLGFATYEGRFRRENIKGKLGLANNVTVSTCPAVIPRCASAGEDDISWEFQYDLLIKTERIKAWEGGEIRHQGIWVQPRYIRLSPDHTWLP